MDNSFLVCVRCMTYNHAPYIKDALNGFCMQETSFPYVCTIVEDASTDGEQDVIKEYLQEHFDLSNSSVMRKEETDDYYLIFAQHKSNKNCFFATLLLKYNHYHKKDRLGYISEWLNNAKYIALCEGDDYWIDPLKLQKQVDFLEANPDFGMVHTDFDLVKGRRNHLESQPDVLVFPDLITKHISIGTPTVIYSASIYHNLPRYNKGKKWPMGDLPTWIEFNHETKIKYLREVTAKYRVLEQSASHTSDLDGAIKFIKSAYEIRQFYAEKYGLDEFDVYNDKYYEELIRISAHLGSKSHAIHYFREAKEKKKISWKSRIFYLSALYPVLKKMIDIYIEV